MKALRLRVGIAAAVALALLVTAWIPAPANADGSELQAALDDYATGKNEEALTKLRAYVQSNPSADEVYGILRDVEESLLLNAMAKGGDHEAYIKYLLSKASPSPSGPMEEDAIRTKVKEAVEGDDVDVRIRARVALRGAGELAVPALVKYLSSEDAATIVNAIMALQQLRSDATLPLVEALHSDDANTRGYVASVLGQLGDERAGPALLAASDDEDPNVAAKASEAAAKLGANAPAAQAYVALGNRYYDGEATVVRAFHPVMNMWRWEDGGLARYEVPVYLYANQMAEEAAADALSENPALRGARVLLVRSILAQGVESRARAEHGKEAPEILKRAELVAKSLGFNAASGAMAASLDASDWEVAAAACDLMAKNYGGQSLDDTAIPAALESGDRRLRFAAARAALRMSPDGQFRNANLVASIAAQAVSNDATRQVLVVDHNNETRSALVSILSDAQMIVGAERQGGIAANRAKSAPTLDVILVRANLGQGADTVPSQQYQGRMNSSLALIEELGSDPRTKDMRILVLVDDANDPAATKELFQGKFGDAIAGFVETPLVDANVANTVQEAANARDPGPDQGRANEVAAATAEAFAAVDPSCNVFDLSAAAGPLSDAATDGATDAIKMGAIKALGNIRVGGADALLKVLADGSDEMKLAAATALGNVLSAVDGTDEQIGGLMAAAKGDGDVATAALESLGKVRNLSPEKFQEVFRAHRLPVGTKGD